MSMKGAASLTTPSQMMKDERTENKYDLIINEAYFHSL